MTNINDLLNKIENEGKTPSGRVSAEEFNRLVAAVAENQGAVHKVTIDNVDFVPDEDGNVTLIIDQGDITYSLVLEFQSTPQVLQRNTDVNVNVRVKSSYKREGITTPLAEVARVVIKTRTSIDSDWVNATTIAIATNSETYTTIPLKSYLNIGTNYVQFQAISDNTRDVVNEFEFNVVNLTLTPNNSFERPFTDTLTLNYLISGSYPKQMQFQFGSGNGSYFVPEFSYLNDNRLIVNLDSSSYMESGRDFSFTDSDILESMLATGVHTVKARLYVSEDVQTDWVETQFMVAGNVPYIALNNITTSLTNWTDVHFFDWATTQNIAVIFRLTNEEDTLTYATWNFDATAQTSYNFSTQLGIELQDSSTTQFYGIMHIEDESGNALADNVVFTIANSAAFVPTSGADLIITPANRNNSEPNPDRVINNANGNEISSTFTNFGFLTDGWMPVNKDVNAISSNAETIRALHIPSGRKLDIDYNPFVDFTSGNNAGLNMTLEFDFRTSNILDESDPIIKIGTTANDGNIWGFEMLPTKAYMLTENERNVADQDVDWAEDTRMHMAINVVYGLRNAAYDERINLVRIFLNGVIEREFTYNANDRFTTTSGVHIVMGNDSSDLDIFGIRSYRKALSVDDVMRDYRSSLSTSSEKIAFLEANDIIEGGVIDFAKCQGKYNIIGFTGATLPQYSNGNNETVNGDLYINIVGDPDHSGTLTNLDVKGQGTTAMTYFYWNQQYKITDTTQHLDLQGNTRSGMMGKGYAIKDGEALAKKLVGKINFASSMQSHKLGLTWIYTDLYKQVINEMPSQIQRYPNARLAVLEKPFLFFWRTSANSPWVFKNLMTFGAGKGDKPTFGFSSSTTPNMMMVEGADNDRPLALFAMPWNDDVVYNTASEAWMYNNQKQLNFGFGTTTKVNGEEVPSSESAINAMKAFFNFVYLHHSGINYFNGTLSELKRSAEVSRSKLYWVTKAETGSNIYDLYRYDALAANWVKGGVDGDTLNLRSQYVAFCSDTGDSARSFDGLLFETINEIFKEERRKHFKNNAETYFHVDDALYHSCFVKFFAATDNRAKNTYYYTDPETLKVRWMQDDLDTVIKTNNVGQNRKPYYVEEHDLNASGEYYWQGEASGFYNLLEEAFEVEMTTMMRRMLSGMAALGGSVIGFLEQYLLSTQDYFPAIAYNEQASKVYETAAIAQEAGAYTNSSARAISQSCGSQRWSEYQWLVDRIMYISSWCEYGEFAASSSAPNALGWRASGKATGTNYNFVLTPAKWLYPRVGFGESNVAPTAIVAGKESRVRVQAGQTFAFPTINLDTDSTLSIKGINYYLDIGDMNVGLSSSQGTFTFAGRKLQQINVNPTGGNENEFLATNIIISSATNIKTLKIRGVNTLTGSIDISRCSRLESIDLRGTTANNVALPASNALTDAYMPATLTSINITQQPNLGTFNIESETTSASGTTYLGGALLERITILGNSYIDSYSIISLAYSSGAELTQVTIDNVDWEIASTVTLIKLANINADLRGVIDIIGSNRVTFNAKRKLVEVWGNIDDSTNPLYITYVVRTITDYGIYGNDYIGELGDYTMEIVPDNANANGFKSIQWSLSNNIYATINSNTGLLTVNRIGTEDNPQYATLTCTLTTMSGSRIVRQKNIWFYLRSAHLGDMVYADGTFSDVYDKRKTIVGICWYIDDEHPDIRLMVGNMELIVDSNWGVRDTSSSSTGIPGLIVPDNPDYKIDDTPVPNIPSNSNLSNTDEKYLNDDGSFKFGPNGNSFAGDYGVVMLTEDLMDCKAGDFIPVGRYKTLLIIKHRNYLLNNIPKDSSAEELEYFPIPTKTELQTEMQNLTSCVQAIRDEMGGNYAELYYISFSQAYAYEPQIKDGEVLSDKFKAHNWYVGAVGEWMRIGWYHRKGYVVGVDNAIFANAVTNGGCIKPYTGQSSITLNTSTEVNGYQQAYARMDNVYATEGKTSHYVRFLCAF